MVKVWEPLKEEIKKLYLTEDKPLKEVMRLVKGKYEFHASERSYRTQLLKWKFAKYSTESNPRPKNGTKASGTIRLRRSVNFTIDQSASTVPTTDPSRNLDFQLNFPSIPSYSQVDSSWQLDASEAAHMRSSSNQYHGFNQNISNPGISTPAHQTLSINEQDIEGKTQLHRAAIQVSSEQVKSLLFSSAAVDITDHVGNEPLHYAVLSGNLIIVKDLLRFGANCNAKGQLGRSPLHLATSSLEIAATLLLNGATASARDDNGDTALHLFLLMEPDQYSMGTIIDKLIGSGSDVNFANNVGFTPFHTLAARTYHTDSTLSLLEQFLLAGASVNFPFPDGTTPFHHFLTVSKYEWLWKRSRWESSKSNAVFKQFLSKGADPLTPVESFEPLAVAVIRHKLFNWRLDLANVELLCKKVSTGPVMPNGNSILHELCSICRTQHKKEIRVEQMIDTLLERGAYPNLRNQDGQSPLALLFDSKDNINQAVKRVMSVLLAHGANPTLVDDNGQPVLFKAAKRLTWEELKPLVRADIKQRKTVVRPVVIGSIRWCYQWEQIAQTQSWDEAKDMILSCADLLPSDIEEKIRFSALAAIAEKHIDLVKSMFDGDPLAVEKRRKHLAAILRDCRAQRMEIDMAHLDNLLELSG